MAGIYGGVVNAGPGLMGLWFSKAIASLGLGGAYAFWLIMLILAVGTSPQMIFSSPDQIIFRRRREAKKDGRTTTIDISYTLEELEEMKESCQRCGQDLFPAGSVTLTLKQCAKT